MDFYPITRCTVCGNVVYRCETDTSPCGNCKTQKRPGLFQNGPKMKTLIERNIKPNDYTFLQGDQNA